MRFPFCCYVFLLFIVSCNHSTNLQNENEEKIKALLFKTNKFAYYKEFQADSLFTEEMIQNDSIKCFTDIEVLKFIYGERSRALFEQYFNIQDYREMPSMYLLKDIPFTNNVEDSHNAKEWIYWLDSSTEDEGYMAILTELSVTNLEQFTANEILDNGYYMLYPNQKRQVNLRIGFSKSPYPITVNDTLSKVEIDEQKELTKYLTQYKIQLLDYFNIMDSLNQNDWNKEEANHYFSNSYPQRSLQIIQINQTIPSDAPQQIKIDKSERWFENYEEKTIHVIISDTISSSKVNIPVEWSIYLNQFSPKNIKKI